MARDDERLSRSQQPILVGSLPDAPGILTAIRLTPGLGIHLRGPQSRPKSRWCP